MSYCWNRSITWVQRLRVGMDYRDYTVRLDRQIGCFCEAYDLYVNDQPIVDHKLTYNPFSPLCCSGGQFEFDRDGHTFLVMFDSFSWTKRFGEFRLFIDGEDVNSKLEYSAFWRRRGWQIVSLGAFLLGVAILSVLIFVFLPPHTSSAARLGRIICPAVATTGAIYLLTGITVILRQRKPKALAALPPSVPPSTSAAEQQPSYGATVSPQRW